MNTKSRLTMTIFTLLLIVLGLSKYISVYQMYDYFLQQDKHKDRAISKSFVQSEVVIVKYN